MRRIPILITIIAIGLVLTGCPGLLGPEDEDNGTGDSPATTTVAAPVFSLEQGQYVGAQSLTLTTETEGATIYYHFDFDTPDTNDQEYSGPVTVDATTHMTAVAVKDGVTSDVSYNSFAIREDGYSNQIANGDFSEGTAGWWMYVNTDNGAEASWTTTDSDNDGNQELAVTIQSGGSEGYHVQPFFLVGFPSQEGELYELTFTAWVDDAGSRDFRSLIIALDENGEDVNGNDNRYDTYFWQREVLTETPRTFTKRIAMYDSPDHEHPRTRLAFNLGTDQGIEAGGTVYIEDVSLEPVTDPESFETVVTSPAMRTALMESIHDAEDREDQRRFDGLTEGDVTAYHLAALYDIDLYNDLFEDNGFSVGDFDFSAIDVTKFGALEKFRTDDLPLTDDDLESLTTVTSIRRIDIGNSTGDSGTSAGVTDISSLTDLKLLSELQLQENKISISDLIITITPDIFPVLEGLELGFAELSPSSTDMDDVIGMFTSFVDAGNRFRYVAIQNAPLTDNQFTVLHNDVLNPSSTRLEGLSIGGWKNPGTLTSAVLNDLGTLTSLRELEIVNHALTTLDGLESLVNLEYLGTQSMSGLTDFSALASLSSLRDLEVGGTDFGSDPEDGDAIANLPELEELDISNTPALDALDAVVTLFSSADTETFSDGGYINLGWLTNDYYEANSTHISDLENLGLEVDYTVGD
ncbi:MAG: chitobiase/beta-hexosaminidase C-terminal domain-containing protein [Alkalispirochaeta sp.]